MNKQAISRKILTRKIKDAGYEHTFIDVGNYPKETLFEGDIFFDSLPCGIDLHCADIQEKVTGHSASEISAGLSINVLFVGKVSFALGKHQYIFDAKNSPVLFINVFKDNQLFTRLFEQGRHVSKFNITVSKSWLKSRCATEAQVQHIEKLFAHGNEVFQWQDQHQLNALAQQLFCQCILQQADDLSSSQNDMQIETAQPQDVQPREVQRIKAMGFKWQLEQSAFVFFNQAFDLLFKATEKKLASCQCVDFNPQVKQADYEKKIEQRLFEPLSLEQLAAQLGASISTLQRYFKARHQLTLKEYIRNQKLEYARRALIFENKSVGEVAYLTGYNHVPNFAAAFKKYFLETPAALQSKYHRVNDAQ